MATDFDDEPAKSASAPTEVLHKRVSEQVFGLEANMRRFVAKRRRPA